MLNYTHMYVYFNSILRAVTECGEREKKKKKYVTI